MQIREGGGYRHKGVYPSGVEDWTVKMCPNSWEWVNSTKFMYWYVVL